MVFTVFINHSVRVVHPSVEGERSDKFGRNFFHGWVVSKGVGKFHFLAASGIIRRKIDTDRVIGVHLKLERNRFARESRKGLPEQSNLLYVWRDARRSFSPLYY